MGNTGSSVKIDRANVASFVDLICQNWFNFQEYSFVRHLRYNTEEKLHIGPFEITNVLVRQAQNEYDPYDLYDPPCLRRSQLPSGIPTKSLHHTDQLSETFAAH